MKLNKLLLALAVATSAVVVANHATSIDDSWMWEAPWGRAPALAIDACLLWFFNKLLSAEDPPFPSNPEIYDVQRK